MKPRHRYSRVSRRIWRDGKVRRLTAPPPCGRSLWVWLLTCDEQGPIPGMIPRGEAALAEAIEWPLKGFRKAFAEVLLEGMVKADWEARIVWLPKAVRHNEPSSPNVILSWQHAWDELPECAIKDQAFRELEAYASAKGKAWLKAFRKACAKPSGNQKQKQEQDQEQDQEQKQEAPPMCAKRRKGPMPQGWSPNGTALARCTEYGLDPFNEADAFREWTSAKGMAYANWDAAFLNHLRSQHERARGGRGQVNEAQQRIDRQLARVAALEAEEAAEAAAGGKP